MANLATAPAPVEGIEAARHESRTGAFPTMDYVSAALIHDLRNPLAAIYGCAEMLLDGDLDRVQTKRVISNIHRAASRMRELLADLAGSTQGHTETAGRCNLRAIVAAACEASGAAARDGIELQVDVPARIEVPMARNRMVRVFLNLIVNALEAMPGGGIIRISSRRAGDSVAIELEDTGPGIPDEIRGRLFEPFVTARKEGGLGLGLALSRQAVRDHGGEMWAEPAAGARFVISLPLGSLSPYGLPGSPLTGGLLRSPLTRRLLCSPATGGNHEFGM